MIAKGDITTGAFRLLRIWGITSKPKPEEIQDALTILDDYALELESDGLLTGYQSPEEYGCSDPNDDSGLADWMAGPFKKLLAVQVGLLYGKSASVDLAGIAKMSIQSLQHALVIVPPAQLPGTLPKGSGNEWAYNDNKFYPEQAATLDTETNGTIDDITLNDNYPYQGS